MNLKTRKIIAREFLILFIVMALAVIGFLCTYPYNFYKKHEIENLVLNISKKQKILDSINKALGHPWLPPVTDSVITNDSVSTDTSFLAPLITAEKWDKYRVSQREPPDLIKGNNNFLPDPPPHKLFIESTWTPPTDAVPVKLHKIPSEQLYERLILLGYTETNLGTKDEFIRHVQNVNDANKLYKILIKEGFTEVVLGKKDDFLKALKVLDPLWTNRINLFNRSQKVESEIKNTNSKKGSIEQQIFSFQDQIRFGFLTTLLFLILLFGFRYLFYAVSWSVKTLKQ